MSIRGRVRAGRLLVDAPTDLPDGLEITLTIVEDDLEREDRRALHEALSAAAAEAERGELEDAHSVIDSLRTR
ncbi:MAG: hypothetical protein J0L92_35170 [Deltaproteobacteria bacterium]|nr:hypothetical protein [Deltaproteobacteria bacterium]